MPQASRDHFGPNQSLSRLWPVWAGIAVLLLLVLFTRAFHLSDRSQPEVIAYCAQDQVYAEPLFKDFEQETGIRVRAVFDSEAVKTVGLANRLLAERNHPQCDLFWSNEEMRTRQLAAQGVFRETNGWTAFGYRSRRIVINTNLVRAADVPRSLLDLTNTAWQGKVALAYPQFGTTAAHFHALRQCWGEPLWLAWCRGLIANKPSLVDGNSVVVKFVGNGQAWIGLTDSDDIAAGQREGMPVAALAMNSETLLVPNTVAITRNAPHPTAAERLFEFLQRARTVQTLIEADALEGGTVGEKELKKLTIDWNPLLEGQESTTAKLNEIFLR
jgi:iron(III) transport system substrate-binding protein